MEPTVSACMIVRDEEDVLGGCLESIHDVVDEMIVVDTGSQDNTVEIAEEYGAEVYEYEWEGHFGEARNYSFDQATEDWILYIDADERLSPKFRQNIDELLEAENDILYKVPIEDELLTCLGPNDGMIRLWKRGQLRFEEGKTSGKSASTQMPIYNDEERFVPYPILHCQRGNHWLINPTRIFPRIAIDAENATKDHSSLFYYGASVWAFFKHFGKWFVLNEGYKDGKLGFKLAFIKGIYYALLNFFIGLRPDHPSEWKEWRRDDMKEKLQQVE